MRFNVSGLEQEGIGASREYEIDGAFTAPGRAAESVTGSVELLRTNRGVLVRARLWLVEPEDCSRCLKPLQETLPIEFEEEFLMTVDVRSGQPAEEPPNEDDFLVDEHHMLDLTEAIRQYREASAAIQTICRPDCRGLCPSCGHDLNTGDCDCRSPSVNNPWSVLAGLLPNPESEGKV